MKDARKRNARRRVFMPEALEGRKLLSTARPMIAAMVGPVRGALASSLQGRVSGTQASDGLYGGTPAGYSSYSGHGHTSQSDVLFGTTFLASPGFAENGSAVFRTGSTGDQVQVNFVGVTTSSFARRTTYQLEGEVMGGSGRYDGARGPFSGTLVTFGTRGLKGSFSLTYAMRFDEPV